MFLSEIVFSSRPASPSLQPLFMAKPIVLSVVGARPNFMKVAPLHRALSAPAFASALEHRIVHTGQHYDAAMSDAFFRDLEMPEPSYFLGVGSGTHAAQTAKTMLAFEEICMEVKPALTIVVGDVNSTLAAAVVAAKLGAPVAHVEAGLRSGDRAMPEEINRIVADAVSDYAFVTEQSGVDNLLRENFRAERIFFVGNTMIDSLYFALSKAGESRILEEIGIEGREFALVTLHRPSNVDDARQLGDLAEILLETARRLALVFPLHPRTRQNLERFGLLTALRNEPNIVLTEPLGYIAFVALIRRARFVMTDSGGVQEETTALGVPCLTLRTTTERPVTCELGSNTLVHPSPENIRAALDRELNAGAREFAKPPLWDGKAAERIAEIIASLILP